MQAATATAGDVSQAQLARAFRAFDAANADDPARIFVRGREQSKELAHAELACAWVAKLCARPSAALQLAARAHHLRRWTLPRARHPQGRRGYHAWRRELQHFHAEEAGRILQACGFASALVTRVQQLIRKERRDEEAQAFEDALCLVFLETQLEALATRFATAERESADAHAKTRSAATHRTDARAKTRSAATHRTGARTPSLLGVLRRTLAKMSPRARELAAALPLGVRGRELFARALVTPAATDGEKT